jgi:hypothetical protein
MEPALAQLFAPPYHTISDANGDPISGGKAYFYVSGGLVPASVYTTSALNVAHAFPVVADSAGRLAAIYLDPAVTYRVIIKDATGGVIRDTDPLPLPTTDSLLYLATGSGAVSRTLSAKLGDTVSVKDFGAVGDGSTNDYTAFSNALAALSTGARLLVPRGNYALASASLATPLAIPAGVVIEGDNAVITVTGSSTTNGIFKATNVSNVGVRGIRFIGNCQGNAYTNGNAITFLHSSAASADMTDLFVEDCYFENFKTTFWVEFLAQNATYAMRRYRAVNNTFKSSTGNSIDPTSISWNATFICVFADASVSGKIYDGLISGNIGEGTHVKSGIQIYHSVTRTIVTDNNFVNCGQSGASNDTGAYAIFAYADPTDTHSDLTITGNRIENARSIGIYIRGDWRRSEIIGNSVNTVTDTSTTTLPKGGIVVLAGTDFAVRSNHVESAAAFAYFFQSNGTNATLRAIFEGNSDYSCGTGVRLNIIGATVTGLLVSRHNSREFTGFGCAISMYDTGTLVDASVDGNFQSTQASTTGITVAQIETNVNVTRLRIGGKTIVKATSRGVDINANTSGFVRVEEIRFLGAFSSAGLFADSAKVRLVDLTFDGQTVASGGYCVRLTSATGTIKDLDFSGSEDGAIYNASGTVLGVAAPTHSGNKGDVVQNLNPAEAGSAASKYILKEWTCETTTTWRACRALTGN